jgi:cellulose synthase/poly-beta-1,6-N-acetylglucosamine synthase-like glycosyltransferase/peptidoglycan/xylan/chitin deacetylase (PgdA/CDA1 family)/spore germination protein YaaH
MVSTVEREPGTSVFADPRGFRKTILRIAIALFLGAVLAAAGSFVWSLLLAPKLLLPSELTEFRSKFRPLPPPGLPPRDIKDDWKRIAPPARPRAVTTTGTNASVVLGYLAPWDPASQISLERHADALTHVAADWFSLTGVEGTLREEPADKARLLCVRRGLGFLPILKNLDGDEWQPEAVEELANAPESERRAFLDRLVSRLPPGSTGLVVEWCQTDPLCRNEVTRLVKEMGARLHASGKELWFTAPTGSDFNAFDLDEISDVADRLIAPLYDENSEPGDPGPIASSDWFQGWLGAMMVHGEPQQWVIGLGAYGYDWRKDDGSLEQVGFTDVMARAAQSGVDPAKDIRCEEGSPVFEYLGGDRQDRQHELWFLDAVTFANQRRIAAPYHPGGIAIHRLGEEDPAIWSVLRTDPSQSPSPSELAALSGIRLDELIASTGEGDFLTVGPDPKPGARLLEVTDGEIKERYTTVPVPESIARQGDPGPKKVAITFDDGPDPKWTPKILEILRRKKAPAAFFVLGTQAQHYPDLLERIVREGHEIGNHTYSHQNLAETSDEQTELELNATTRLIEAVTDRSTALFRPPYNSDGTPTQPGEMSALRVARDLGYLTVTQSIDPDDWERPGVEALVSRVREQRAARGAIILLHDGGGDRSQTVEALPAIIDALRSRGDEIVPLSEIVGLPRDTLMPPLRHESQPLAARYVYGAFAVLRFLENAAWTLLVIVTLLSLLRVLFLGICAFRQGERERRRNEPEALPGPVSVLLAAYNEERVIASTIRHLLESDYPPGLEVLVVDDGSRDGTARVAAEAAAADPRVKLFRQPNGGKASALRRALEEASHDTIVMIDADTMVASDGIRRLVAPLSREGVGAVAGYIRVGNTKRWLGRFQDLEYVTAFEIDRRAQDLLDCILVAPGALSAFRKEALQEAGPISEETLAEDTDLTLQLHRLGWRVAFVHDAHADTEVPESVKALVSQRFRWAFGTLQCLWKHRDMTFAPGSGWIGWFALPSVWVFQIAVVAVTPVLDLIVLWSLWMGRGIAIWPYFLASLILDMTIALAALVLAGRPLSRALLAVPMRLFYRPLLGYVVWKCIGKALGGSWVRWSKLERTASAVHQKQSVSTPVPTDRP